MKWAVIGALFFFYFFGKIIFNAMVEKDYDTIYDGIQTNRAERGLLPDDSPNRWDDPFNN